MSPLKVSTFLCLLALGAIAAVNAASANQRISNCSIMRRCSNIEDVVWASDGQLCQVYRNGCIFDNANCSRQKEGLSALITMTKDECQKICPIICPMMYAPICGDYNGNKREFPSPCAMNSHVCTSGETYSLFKEGECPSDEYVD